MSPFRRSASQPSPAPFRAELADGARRYPEIPGWFGPVGNNGTYRQVREKKDRSETVALGGGNARAGGRCSLVRWESPEGATPPRARVREGDAQVSPKIPTFTGAKVGNEGEMSVAEKLDTPEPS